MGKVKIYIKLVNGVLEYRDSESQHGKTITTSVDPGDSVVWKLDKCSGISEITALTINGSAKFFSEGPEKKDFDEWKADVSHKASGQITYDITVEQCGVSEEKLLAKGIVYKADAPVITVKG